MNPWRTVVVEAPTQTDLTRVETVMKELNIKVLDDDGKALLLERIRRASADVVRYCNREFALQTVRDEFRPQNHYGSERIFLSMTPVKELVSISDGSSALVLDDYSFNPKSGEVVLSVPGVWPDWPHWTWPSNFSVTYKGGYKLMDDLPRDLEDAVISVVKSRYFGSRRDPMIRSESVPGVLTTEYWVGSVGEDGKLPPDVVASLSAYKRYAI